MCMSKKRPGHVLGTARSVCRLCRDAEITSSKHEPPSVAQSSSRGIEATTAGKGPKEGPSATNAYTGQITKQHAVPVVQFPSCISV